MKHHYTYMMNKRGVLLQRRQKKKMSFKKYWSTQLPMTTYDQQRWMFWMSNETPQNYLKEKFPAILKRILKKSNGKNRLNSLYIKNVKNKSNASVRSIFLLVYLISESVTWSDALAKYSFTPSLEEDTSTFSDSLSCFIFHFLPVIVCTAHGQWSFLSRFFFRKELFC